MTRINAGVNPSELKRAHLLAEWREITMVPAALKRSLNSKSINQVLRSIPSEFTLNTGHVSFFYDKLTYLTKRMMRIEDELRNRGFSPDTTRYASFFNLPKEVYGEWSDTAKARELVLDRIALRISEKPHLYVD